MHNQSVLSDPEYTLFLKNALQGKIHLIQHPLQEFHRKLEMAASCKDFPITSGTYQSTREPL